MFRLQKKFSNREPPPNKRKIFDTRFGLIHVQTGKKKFRIGTPPPPIKGKIFWHQIWLDTCSDWKKKNSNKDPPSSPSKGKILTPDLAWYMFRLEKKKFRTGTPPPSPGIASTCYGYAAGGVPLAFTQEDFLVPMLMLYVYFPNVCTAGHLWFLAISTWDSNETLLSYKHSTCYEYLIFQAF